MRQQEFQTVFHLVAAIDKKFDEIFNPKDANGKYTKYESISDKERPCMTYGISFTYLKHPLMEAYEKSRDLMMKGKSKEYGRRNRILFQVQKHSGQNFEGVIDKNIIAQFGNNGNKKSLLTYFIGLLDVNNSSSLKEEKSEQFINSITQKLLQYESTIIACAKEPQRIQDLFDNIFNEKIHDDFRGYLNNICSLLIVMLSNYPNDKSMDANKRSKEVVKTIHGMLRFIHFIRDNEFRK